MKQLGGMDILELIGTGGYGRVFRVRAPSGAEYAAKVIDERHLEGRAVRRELRALTLLQERAPTHPALIPIRQVGRAEGHLFYTMPLAASFRPPDQSYIPKSLSAEIREGPQMSLPQALDTVRGLLSGLRALHEAGIIHRDLKPSNVLWMDGCWAIGDFGLAIQAAERTSEAGTVGFSPSSAGLGTSDDCFALGKILYCLLTGSRATRYPELNSRLLNSGARSDVRRVIRFLNQVCHPDPSRRFADAYAMETALTALFTSRHRPVAPSFSHVALLTLGTAVAGLTMAGTAMRRTKPAAVEQPMAWTDPSSGLQREYGLLFSPHLEKLGERFPPVPAALTSVGWDLATIDSEEEFLWLYHAYGSQRKLWQVGDPLDPDGPRGIGPALAAPPGGATDDRAARVARFVNPRFGSPFPQLAPVDLSTRDARIRVLVLERPHARP